TIVIGQVKAVGDVVIGKLTLDTPAGKVTVAGTWTRWGLALATLTTAPPAGAAPVRFTVAVVEFPPVTVAGFSENAKICCEGVTWAASGNTLRFADATTTSEAMMLLFVPFGSHTSPFSVIKKLAVVAPAGTVTLEGTVIRAGLSVQSC